MNLPLEPLADIAQSLAEKRIAGRKSDPGFRQILTHYMNGKLFHDNGRVYRDREVYRGFKNGWCAAFVYYCAVEAGLGLPMRVMCKDQQVRNFSGVRAWLEWGERMGFIHMPEGFAPRRGDIVIYNRIIPVKYRERNGLWHDHIGIVLACDAETITVAEGCIDNRNVGGIVTRNRDEHIGRYLRFPENYKYLPPASDNK